MHVNYSIEQGLWCTDAVPNHIKIQPLYKQHGYSGLFYLMYFGLPFSPYGFEFDLPTRDELVLIHMKAIGLKTTVRKREVDFPTAYYHDEQYTNAYDALSSMGIGPSCFWDLRNLKMDEWRRQDQLNKRTWVDDPDKQLKQATADQKSYDVLKDVRKQIRDVEEYIRKQFAPDGQMLCLDEILVAV